MTTHKIRQFNETVRHLSASNARHRSTSSVRGNARFVVKSPAVSVWAKVKPTHSCWGNQVFACQVSQVSPVSLLFLLFFFFFIGLCLLCFFLHSIILTIVVVVVLQFNLSYMYVCQYVFLSAFRFRFRFPKHLCYRLPSVRVYSASSVLLMLCARGGIICCYFCKYENFASRDQLRVFVSSNASK